MSIVVRTCQFFSKFVKFCRIFSILVRLWNVVKLCLSQNFSIFVKFCLTLKNSATICLCLILPYIATFGWFLSKLVNFVNFCPTLKNFVKLCLHQNLSIFGKCEALFLSISINLRQLLLYSVKYRQILSLLKNCHFCGFFRQIWRKPPRLRRD